LRIRRRLSVARMCCRAEADQAGESQKFSSARLAVLVRHGGTRKRLESITSGHTRMAQLVNSGAEPFWGFTSRARKQAGTERRVFLQLPPERFSTRSILQRAFSTRSITITSTGTSFTLTTFSPSCLSIRVEDIRQSAAGIGRGFRGRARG